MPKKPKALKCENCGGPVTESPAFYKERARKRLKETSFHEAGHYVVSTELKSPAVAFLTNTGCQCDTFHPYYAEVSQIYVGKDSFWNGWKGGAICIAGIVAETLTWERLKTFEQLHEMAWVNFEEMWEVQQVSQSDDEGLINLPPNQLTRAYDFACNVIWKKRENVKEVAEKLRTHGIYPTDAKRYSKNAIEFSKKLRPSAALQFFRGFPPEKDIQERVETMHKVFAEFERISSGGAPFFSSGAKLQSV